MTQWASSFLISLTVHAAVLSIPTRLIDIGVESPIAVTLVTKGKSRGQKLAPEATPSRGKRLEVNPVPRPQGGGFGAPRFATQETHFSPPLPAGLPAWYGVKPRRPRKETPTEGEKTQESTPSSSEPSLALPGKADLGEHGLPSRSRAEEQTTVEAGPDGRQSRGTVAESGDQGREVGIVRWPFAQPDYAHNPKPEYPQQARRAGWEGTVLLHVLVSQEGNPVRVEVSHSSGFESLDRAALKAVKGWRFRPARYGEKQVESWVKIPIVFSLTK